MTRQEGKWMDGELVDMLGRPFSVGDKVVKAISSGRAVNIEIAEVTEIRNDRVYLSNSRVPINFPGRLLIVNEVFASK